MKTLCKGVLKPASSAISLISSRRIEDIWSLLYWAYCDYIAYDTPFTLLRLTWRRSPPHNPLSVSSKDRFDMMMMTCNHLSKGIHIFNVHSKMMVTELVKVFVKDVWRAHGLLDSIVSDWDVLFISELWRAINHRLRTNLDLTSSYHSESDSQTERYNVTVEEYLQHYVNLHQDDWSEWTPLAEFTLMNAVFSATGMSSFFANNDFHLRMAFNSPRSVDPTASKHIKDANAAGNAFAQKMSDILDELQNNICITQAKYEAQTAICREAASVYRVGDKVYLDTRNIHTDQVIKKLDYRWYGLYRVSKAEITTGFKFTHHYSLDLSQEFQSLINSFHTSLLCSAPWEFYSGQINSSLSAISLDKSEQALWAVKTILDLNCNVTNGFKYEILWRGYRSENCTWEFMHHVMNCNPVIKEFERHCSEKLKLTKTEIKKAKALLARQMKAKTQNKRKQYWDCCRY